MKTLIIEWKHLEQHGATCTRCGDTGRSLRNVVRSLRRLCSSQGVAVRFIETKLPPAGVSESNTLFFNGVKLETALDLAPASTSDCASCSTLVGAATRCQTIERHGAVYEANPEELIREAACRVGGCECSPRIQS